MTESCFQLKGSVVTVVVLELHRHTDAFVGELAEKIQRAPQLLLQSPVVINLEKYAGQIEELDLAVMLAQCRDLGLQPIGFRGAEGFGEAVTGTGLARLPAASGRGSGSRELESGPAADGDAAAETPAAEADPAPVRGSKLVTQPVRSGQQVYARDADLIVMSQVSEGAEVLADGNIHIYGGLRGRALAGVRGDTAARIFCQRMEAELLSVAGNFILSDDMRDDLHKKPVQVYLRGDELCLELL
jgi:septum site-determining protein MinC